MEHIAIIGGGIAGISAALTLQERGYKYTIFEKENKLGGHAFAQEYKGKYYDMGYIYGQDRCQGYEGLRKIYKQLDIQVSDSYLDMCSETKDGRYYVSDSPYHIQDIYRKRLIDIINLLI